MTQELLSEESPDGGSSFLRDTVKEFARRNALF